MRKVLVTGATGMIGGELALRLARTDDVYCLVRGTEQEALAKLKARGLDGVKLILGDLTGPYQLPDLDLVVHAAAETSFVQDERCQLTNVRGTELLLERLAAQKFSGLFCYISTACNVGAVLGACLREEEGCLVDNRHHNSYTLSKAHAETLVQRSGLDVLTIRPSVVVSAGIDNPVFARQILWFAPLIRKFSSLPLVRSSRLDVIPVAFLADATIGLIDRPVRRHDCYNVSAGRQAATLGDWLVEIEAHYPPAAPLQIVESLDEAVAWRPRWTSAQQARIFAGLSHYLPFFNMDTVFDNGRLQEELGRLEVPTISTYLHGLFSQLTERDSLAEAAAP